VKVEVKPPPDCTPPSAVCISPVPPPSASQHCIVSSAVGQKVNVTTVSLEMMFLTSLDKFRSVFVVEYMGLNFLGCLKLQCSVYCLHSTPHNHGILGGGGGGEGGSEASPRLDLPSSVCISPVPPPSAAQHCIVSSAVVKIVKVTTVSLEMMFPFLSRQHSLCLRQSIRETQLPWMSEVSLYAV
jgi:hypothetical protein